MRIFKNFDTNEIWTEDEIRSIYNSDYVLTERFQTFEACIEYLLDLGRQFTGGLTEIESPYTVIAVGGKFDGEELFWTDDEHEAFEFAKEHLEDFPMGCAVFHGGEVVAD